MVIGSLQPEHCVFCGRTHYIGDARGPGTCPTDVEIEIENRLDVPLKRNDDEPPPEIK
jgi:hypothetical protein